MADSAAPQQLKLPPDWSNPQIGAPCHSWDKPFRLPKSAERPQRHSVHLLVLSSCATHARLANLTCSRLSCTVYLDDPRCTLAVRQLLARKAVLPAAYVGPLVVPPGEYIDERMAGPIQCCDPNEEHREDTDLVPSRPVHMTFGPTQFFCDAHRKATLRSQYRFLPALAHARAKHTRAFRSGALEWLVLVDDDAIVSMSRLLKFLSGYNHSMPLHMGDFIFAKCDGMDGGHSHWTRMFACGGAGTTLSAAAVLSMDFDACHRAYQRSCLQSDWMISGCAAMHQVIGVPAAGCNACVGEPEDLMRSILNPNGCLSAQYQGSLSDTVNQLMESQQVHHMLNKSHASSGLLNSNLKATVKRLLLERPAIVHLAADDHASPAAELAKAKAILDANDIALR